MIKKKKRKGSHGREWPPQKAGNTCTYRYNTQRGSYFWAAYPRPEYKQPASTSSHCLWLLAKLNFLINEEELAPGVGIVLLPGAVSVGLEVPGVGVGTGLDYGGIKVA